MGIFSKKSDGGLMNVIRCDEKEYLVWKWRPNNQELGKSKRENSIRYGSSLRVKDGEMAVFVYSGSEGSCQDYIIGPHDDTIKTANFPVLANIVGLAFGGDTPFKLKYISSIWLIMYKCFSECHTLMYLTHASPIYLYL